MCYDSKEAKTTMLPDSDLKVKLDWASGGTSGYVKVNMLQKSTAAKFKQERRRAEVRCLPGVNLRLVALCTQAVNRTLTHSRHATLCVLSVLLAPHA